MVALKKYCTVMGMLITTSVCQEKEVCFKGWGRIVVDKMKMVSLFKIGPFS